MHGTTYENLVRVEKVDSERIPVLIVPMERFDEKSIATTMYVHRFTESQRQAVNSILPTVRKMILNEDFVASGEQVPHFDIIDGEKILIRFITEGSTTIVAFRIYLTELFEVQLKEDMRLRYLDEKTHSFIGYGLFGLAIGSAAMMGYLVGKGMFGRSF